MARTAGSASPTVDQVLSEATSLTRPVAPSLSNAVNPENFGSDSGSLGSGHAEQSEEDTEATPTTAADRSLMRGGSPVPSDMSGEARVVVVRCGDKPTTVDRCRKANRSAA